MCCATLGTGSRFGTSVRSEHRVHSSGDHDLYHRFGSSSQGMVRLVVGLRHNRDHIPGGCGRSSGPLH